MEALINELVTFGRVDILKEIRNNQQPRWTRFEEMSPVSQVYCKKLDKAIKEASR